VQLDVNFDEAGPDEQRVAEIFGVSGDDAKARMEALAAAALEEYTLAFSGVRAPSTIKELRELRLRLLYKHLPAGEPTDEQIAQLFQMTPAQVGTLVAGTRARYRDDVGARMRELAIAAMKKSVKLDDDGTRRLRNVSDSLGRLLKELVAQTSAPPVEKRRDASRTYDLGPDTVNAICAQLGIDPGTLP